MCERRAAAVDEVFASLTSPEREAEVKVAGRHRKEGTGATRRRPNLRHSSSLGGADSTQAHKVRRRSGSGGGGGRGGGGERAIAGAGVPGRGRGWRWRWCTALTARVLPPRQAATRR